MIAAASYGALVVQRESLRYTLVVPEHPKPDLVILLYDDPAAIRTRNNELSAEQLEVPLSDGQKLAKRGDVDAVILADTTPSAVAKRILALAMDKFVEKYGVRFARPLSMSTPAESANPLDSMKCRVD